jgi:nitronate monooxygenase
VGALDFVAAGYRSAAAMAEHRAHAPIAYPEIHDVTAPLRAHARRHGDVDLVNLWAGDAHQLARARPAAAVVTGLARDARAALQRAERRMRDPVHASVTA